MDGMDVGMGEELRTMEAINGAHLQSKESEYSLQQPNSDMLELNEMVIRSECENKKNSPDFFTDTFDAINLDRVGASENTCASPLCMNDAGEVEELTLRNYNSQNLAVVGTSRNKDKMHTSKWQHLYQIPGGSGNGGSCAGAACRVRREGMSSIWDDDRCTNNPEALDQNHANNYCNEVAQNFQTNTSKPSNPLFLPGGIRTKILSKSGFSEYFFKSTLKGKGVICRGPVPEGLEVEFRGQTYPKVAGINKADPVVLLSSNREFVAPPSHLIPKSLSGFGPDSFHDGVSLREWLKSGKNKVNKIKSLYIFKQIVDMVNNSHSRGVALLDLRPSYFKLLPSNEIIYLGSTVNDKIIEKLKDKDVQHPENEQTGKRSLEQGNPPFTSQWAKKRKAGGVTNLVRRWPQFPNGSGTQYPGNEFSEGCKPDLENKPWSNSGGLHVSDSSKTLLPFTSDSSELKWYSSPEELGNKCCTLSSNIYCLGILLFELLCSFDSDKGRAVTMHDLHYRILPPSLLSESPKEAGFCLWLLHPEPSSRPTTRDILQSDFINGIQDLFGNELSSSIIHEDTESELLLHFLDSLKEQKLKHSSTLVEEIRFLEADIDEVERRQTKKSSCLSCSPREFDNGKELISSHDSNSGLAVNYNVSTPFCNESRLMRSFSQLESAYFSERANVQHLESWLTSRDGKELLENRKNRTPTYKDGEISKPADCLGTFFKGLCKYARYTKFKVCGILRNGDFNTNANVICSLSFDRDEDYFAAAGASKKIKIYDFHALFNDSVDIHYPVLELSNKSKLSCTCWNSYIRNYLASTDYDGVVKLWDAGTGQEISQYIEHGRRAWSVDFSRVDPTKLASGSDDFSVKLWNINEKNSLCTIRNIANVCCVQFSAKSSHLIAFGSADYKTYCYDLRNVSRPWCVLAGHDKAVSYVKFLDSETLISASTDNTLKLWNLNKTSTSDLSTNACNLTLRGHTNEKNFVGLSVADDGYIACGSETNEVFAYYRSLPMPITSHKFGSIDPISGKETDDDGGQFVSSVCWRQKSDMVVAANSTGSIKLLQMV